MSSLQVNRCFKLDFKKVNQYTEDKGLIYGTKRPKENQPICCKAFNCPAE